MPGPVSAVDLARWQDAQEEIRHLTLQRGVRFIAAAVLAPFGISGVGHSGDKGGNVSPIAFGVALLLLALAELASLVETNLLSQNRKAMERAHPVLAPKGQRGRAARMLELASGPGFATLLYFVLGVGFIVASLLP